jgi:hypothetical protein
VACGRQRSGPGPRVHWPNSGGRDSGARGQRGEVLQHGPTSRRRKESPLANDPRPADADRAGTDRSLTLPRIASRQDPATTSRELPAPPSTRPPPGPAAWVLLHSAPCRGAPSSAPPWATAVHWVRGAATRAACFAISGRLHMEQRRTRSPSAGYIARNWPAGTRPARRRTRRYTGRGRPPTNGRANPPPTLAAVVVRSDDRGSGHRVSLP